jgi:hypothetical protein
MQPLVGSVPSTHTIERAYCLVKRCVEGGCFSTRVFQSPFPVETKKELSEAVFSYSTDQRGVIKAAVAVALNKCTVQGPHWKEFLFIMYATRRAVATIVYSLCWEFFFYFLSLSLSLSLSLRALFILRHKGRQCKSGRYNTRILRLGEFTAWHRRTINLN